MSGEAEDLEILYRWVSVTIVASIGAAFTSGLILYVLDPNSRPALVALNTGLVLLMASPAVRILLAGAERIRRRDWTFLALTSIVSAEILVVLWRASTRG